MTPRATAAICAALLAIFLTANDAPARDTEGRLLRASAGLQMPGSEADSEWWFVSYPGVGGLPAAESFAGISGCRGYPEARVSRLDFDATLDRLGRVEPWMDRGQKESARGFRKLGKLLHRRYDELAVYRCETGTAEVPMYFVGVNEDGLSGLLTVNVET